MRFRDHTTAAPQDPQQVSGDAGWEPAQGGAPIAAGDTPHPYGGSRATTTDGRGAPGGTSAHRVIRNSTLNLAVQGLHAAFYVVVFAVLARGLGKEAFGEYYLLFAL